MFTGIDRWQWIFLGVWALSAVLAGIIIGIVFLRLFGREAGRHFRFEVLLTVGVGVGFASFAWLDLVFLSDWFWFDPLLVALHIIMLGLIGRQARLYRRYRRPVEPPDSMRNDSTLTSITVRENSRPPAPAWLITLLLSSVLAVYFLNLMAVLSFGPSDNRFDWLYGAGAILWLSASILMQKNIAFKLFMTASTVSFYHHIIPLADVTAWAWSRERKGKRQLMLVTNSRRRPYRALVSAEAIGTIDERLAREATNGHRIGRDLAGPVQTSPA